MLSSKRSATITYARRADVVDPELSRRLCHSLAMKLSRTAVEILRQLSVRRREYIKTSPALSANVEHYVHAIERRFHYICAGERNQRLKVPHRTRTPSGPLIKPLSIDWNDRNTAIPLDISTIERKTEASPFVAHTTSLPSQRPHILHTETCAL